MKERHVQPCYTMWLWSKGGYLLGLVTGLMGRNMIMVCTEAVEDAVHHHMQDQIRFLNHSNVEIKELIESIQAEELEHLNYAQNLVKHTPITRPISTFIKLCTEVLIFLSTQGASLQMKREIKNNLP